MLYLAFEPVHWLGFEPTASCLPGEGLTTTLPRQIIIPNNLVPFIKNSFEKKKINSNNNAWKRHYYLIFFMPGKYFRGRYPILHLSNNYARLRKQRQLCKFSKSADMIFLKMNLINALFCKMEEEFKDKQRITSLFADS